MSRIGKQPITLEADTKVSLGSDSFVTVQGKTKSLKFPFSSQLELKEEKGQVLVQRKEDTPKVRALHGLFRMLIYNAVVGVNKGWSKTLILNGVGYKAQVSGKNLKLNLGYSHPIEYVIPEGVEIKVEKQTKVQIQGADKELVGRVAQKLRSYRPPEPYLGKGIRYDDEVIRRKAGKSGGDKKA